MIIHHGPLIALFSSRVVVYWGRGGRASQIPMTKKNGGCFCVIFPLEQLKASEKNGNQVTKLTVRP